MQEYSRPSLEKLRKIAVTYVKLKPAIRFYIFLFLFHITALHKMEENRQLGIKKPTNKLTFVTLENNSTHVTSIMQTSSKVSFNASYRQLESPHQLQGLLH